MSGMIENLIKNVHALFGIKPETTAAYDLGEGLMVRGKFAQAETFFRNCLADDPSDIDAMLRMCQAMENGGRIDEAAAELDRARRNVIDRSDEATIVKKGWVGRSGQVKRTRQERILLLTYVLGDILVHKLDQVERARRMYSESLEIMYGSPQVAPLRERLAALEKKDRISTGDAVDKLQPLKIKLTDQSENGLSAPSST